MKFEKNNKFMKLSLFKQTITSSDWQNVDQTMSQNFYFSLFLSRKYYFPIAFAKVNRNRLFFSWNFAFMTWVMKFSNFPIS